MSKPHIVLVHGAHHRAIHWKYLKAKLEEAGYKVSTIDLPAAGPDADKLPREGGFRKDLEAVKALLEEVAAESESVLPVFHSYGGVPGGEAAAELSEAAKAKVKRLVYLAAFVLPQGYSCFTLSKGQAAPWAERRGHAIFVPDPASIFYTTTDPELANEAAAQVVPHAYSSFSGETKHTPWEMYPATYVFCSKDRTMLPERQIGWFQMMSREHRANWDSFTIDSDHSPFLSNLDGCAGVIKKIAGEYL